MYKYLEEHRTTQKPNTLSSSLEPLAPDLRGDVKGSTVGMDATAWMDRGDSGTSACVCLL